VLPPSRSLASPQPRVRLLFCSSFEVCHASLPRGRVALMLDCPLPFPVDFDAVAHPCNACHAVVANNSQSQRAAALAAAAALSKRLQGLGGASTSYIPPR